jgi:hypothetical protein
MAPARLTQMKCPLCGMKHTITPEMGGQEIKCRCGHVLRPPAAAPAEWNDETGTRPQKEEIYRLAPGGVPETKGHVHPDPIEIPAPKPMGTALPGLRRPSGATKPQTADANVRKPVGNAAKPAMGVVALVLLVAAIFGARRLAHAPSAPTAPLRGDDARILQMIDEFGRNEAREALSSDRRAIAGAAWTRGQAVHRIEEWYAMGAKDVLAFGGIAIGGFVIELPDAPAKRRPFFDFAEQWRLDHHPKEPPVRDEGQRFLLIELI